MAEVLIALAETAELVVLLKEEVGVEVGTACFPLASEVMVAVVHLRNKIMYLLH